MDSLTATPSNDELSETEQKLLYNVEVLGLNPTRAGELAGVSNPHAVLKRPQVLAAREKMKVALRGRVNITRDDVVNGMLEAIDQAKLIADPMAQIAGWREIAKILGYDQTRKIEININAPANRVREQLQQLSDDDLIELAGAENIIDAEFHEVRQR